MIAELSKILGWSCNALISFGLEFLWRSTLLIMLATLLWLFIKRRTSPRLNRLLWSSTIVVLFVLPLMLVIHHLAELPQLKISSPLLTETLTWQEIPSSDSKPATSLAKDILIKPRDSITLQRSQTSEGNLSTNEGTMNASHGVTSKGFILLIWICGSLYFLLRWILGLYKISQLKRANGNILVKEISTTPQKIRIIASPLVTTPLLCGLLRPRIVVPIALFDKLTIKQKGTTIMHELAHWQQGDLWIQTGYQLLSVFFWFQPLLLWIKRRFHLASEELADDKVLANEKDAIEYANVLQETAKYAYERNCPSLAPVVLMSERSSLKWRITRILSGSLPSNNSPRRLSCISLIVGVIIALISVSSMQTAGSTKQSEPQSPLSSPSSYKISIPEDAPSYPSLKMALEKANAGDLIILQAGQYEGGFALKDGVKICGEDREKTVIKLGRERINANGVKNAGVYNLTIRKGEVGSHLEIKDSKNITVSNCAVIATDFQYSGADVNASDIRFENTTIKSCHYWAVEASSESNVQMVGCTIEFSGYAGVKVENDSTLEATGNVFYGNGYSAISVEKGCQAEIVGNTMIYNSGGVSADADVKLNVHHNTVIGNKGPAVYMSRMVVGEIRDNIFVANESGLGAKEQEFFQVNAHHNLFWKNKHANYGAGFEKGEGDIEADPLFSDMSNQDFRLKENSPALGAASDHSNMGAWNSVSDKQATQWLFTPKKPEPATGGHIIVVQAKPEVTEIKEGDRLTYAKILAKELSDKRSDEAAVKRINEQLQEAVKTLKPEKNLLKNSNFETGEGTLPSSWELRNGRLVEIQWASNLGYNNSKGVYIKKTEGKFPFASLVQTIDCPQDDALLQLSARVKTKDVGKAILDLVFLDESGKWIYHIWVQPIGTSWDSGTHDWTQYVNYAYIPPGTKKIEVSLQMYWPGELWLDDYACRLMK